MIEGDLRFEAISGWAQVPVEAGFVEAVGAAVTWRDEVVVFARADIPVLIFSPEGRYLRGWGQGEFVRPHGIWIGKDDTLYLTDDMGHSVRQYSMSGQLLRMIGPSGTPSPTGIDGMDYRKIRPGVGPYNMPTNLAIGSCGGMFVVDGYGNARVHRFSAQGTLISSWGEPGARPGQFNVPHGIDCDSAGRIFVCDRENSRIQLFDSDGGFLEEWTDVARPCEVFLDADDTVYVAELGWHAGTNDPRFDETGGRVSIFSRQGELLSRFGGGSDPYAPGDFAAPHDIWVDSQGDIYTSEVIASAAVPRGLVGPDCPTLQKFRKI